MLNGEWWNWCNINKIKTEFSMAKNQSPKPATKFMLFPKGGIFIEKEYFEDIDQNQFVVEQAIETKGIIFDKKPNFKKHLQEDGLRFESTEFKNGYSLDKKRQIIFDESFPLKSKRQINKILKKQKIYSYQYESNGLKLLKKYRVIPDEFTIQKVLVTKLEFCTEEISGGCTIISKKDYDQYRLKGMPQSVYEELINNNDFCAPVFGDFNSLTVNGVECDGFHNYLEKVYNQQISNTSKNKKIDREKLRSYPYMFVHDEWIKRSFYQLYIYEKFNIENLRVEVAAEKLHPKSNSEYIFFNLYYETEETDLLEFKFIENFGSNSDAADLYDARGKIVSFDIIDDDEEDNDVEFEG